MKIKQLKEKTIKGFIDFLPKIGINDIEGLLDAINDKLSKSQGGEIKKPIVVTNDDSNYKTIINPDGSIYVFSKNYNGNIFNIIPNGLNINISANNGIGTINIHDIVKLVSKSRKEPIYDASNNTFTASAFKLTYGTNKQVLLGDGSTISDLIRQINIDKTETDYRITIVDINNDVKDIIFNGATKELAGLMTASDKAKLDDIENTYLPLSGGTLTGTLRLNDINSDQNGLDINNVNGIQSVDQYKVLNPEVWTTNGSSINILNLLSNAAIYVEGDTVRINSALLISNETITDPDYIMFEENTGMFIALKNNSYFKNWNISKKRTIGNPIRYGTIIGTSVYPFHNQMYRFRNNTILIANCSGDKPVFNILTL